MNAIPPRRLWVDSARSEEHETAEDGVLETLRSEPARALGSLEDCLTLLRLRVRPFLRDR